MSGAGEVTGGRTWRIGNTTRVLDGDPWLMGILNVTPDSFSDGGECVTIESTGRVEGEVSGGGLVIEEGGVLEGRSRPVFGEGKGS